MISRGYFDFWRHCSILRMIFATHILKMVEKHPECQVEFTFCLSGFVSIREFRTCRLNKTPNFRNHWQIQNDVKSVVGFLPLIRDQNYQLNSWSVNILWENLLKALKISRRAKCRVCEEISTISLILFKGGKAFCRLFEMLYKSRFMSSF